MMTEAIGSEGLEADVFEKNAAVIEKAFKNVMDNRGKGWQEWCDLPFVSDGYLDEMIAYCNGVREKAESFVVFGIGGSALGPIAVLQALMHLHHNELPAAKRKAPKFYVEDNVDPERMAALLDVIDIKTTYFNVITKSGETSETLSQFLIVYDMLKKALGKEEAKKRIIVTTSDGKGTLYNLAKTEGFKHYAVQPGVGGRFSVLCPVGLVPFAVMGIDIKAMLKGAAEMSKASAVSDVKKNPALISAFMQYEEMKRGKNISVLMPYADSLKYMADFYCQIWAESLGKAVDNDGNTVNAGQTPAKSLGVTDQHSQVQLYAEGPYDKVVTFIAVNKYRKETAIPEGCEDIPDVHFLCGHTMNELIDAERKATEYALTVKKRMNHTIILPEINAFTIGELIFYFEMQTAFEGEFLNVNTYNQPGVENGKNAAYALLGRKGYEAKKIELSRAPEKKDAYII